LASSARATHGAHGAGDATLPAVLIHSSPEW
jgi:hypothetical protein